MKEKGPKRDGPGSHWGQHDVGSRGHTTSTALPTGRGFYVEFCVILCILLYYKSVFLPFFHNKHSQHMYSAPNIHQELVCRLLLESENAIRGREQYIAQELRLNSTPGFTSHSAHGQERGTED